MQANMKIQVATPWIFNISAAPTHTTSSSVGLCLCEQVSVCLAGLFPVCKGTGDDSQSVSGSLNAAVKLKNDDVRMAYIYVCEYIYTYMYMCISHSMFVTL